MRDIIKMLIEQFQLKPFQVENTVKLIEDGNTIPFIARYRKEMTGELSDTILRDFDTRYEYLKNLDSRSEEIIRLIDEQQKLTPEIEESIRNAKTIQEIEDIYRPFRPKKKTRASIAREKGLEPLAEMLLAQNIMKGSIDDIAISFICEEKGVLTIDDAISGAMDIIAEDISDRADLRKWIREFFFQEGIIETSKKKDEDSVYSMYYEYKEPINKIAKHRVLAINRGEKEDYLSVKISVIDDRVIDYLNRKIIEREKSITTKYVQLAIEDSYNRLIFPSVEREIRNILTELAEDQAMKVFKENLRNLLLQPPIKGNVVLGLDPAYRTGCKIAVVDETGKVLHTTVIYPTPPQNKVEEAKKVIYQLIEKHKVKVIAIGNGTASKESEIFIADLLDELKLDAMYMIVNEAGASVYSASKLGAEEFPEFDVALRSAVSIARRLQDPLAELVKIDPKSIGVGQYQHDMNQKRLGQVLGGVVEDCVNSVGVDLNTASPSLLSYISGVNATVSKNIVEYREKNGKFMSRKELLKVTKLGAKAFEQCAGFLRIPEADNILDNTSVHPEAYGAVTKLFKLVDLNIKERDAMKNLKIKVEKMGFEELAKSLEIGVPTLKDIIKELEKPGRDPRDELPKPVLVKSVLHMDDLKEGMVLTGTVRNVADFGAFVDIGVHQDGLVHISELADKFVKHPMDVVSVGDIVSVKVLSVDVQKKRISLSMKMA